MKNNLVCMMMFSLVCRFFRFLTFMLIPIQTYQKQSYKVREEG